MKTLLRLESLGVLFVSVCFYYDNHFPWVTFLALILVPDLTMFGYYFGSRVGARCYNLSHTYVFPLLFIGIGFMLDNSIWTMLGLIWTAHIAIDRLLGYGLKYQDNFKKTHLGQV